MRFYRKPEEERTDGEEGDETVKKKQRVMDGGREKRKVIGKKSLTNK